MCWPRDTLYPQKLALTSPRSGGRSVGIVRLRTTGHGVFSFLFLLLTIYGLPRLRHRWESNIQMNQGKYCGMLHWLIWPRLEPVVGSSEHGKELKVSINKFVDYLSYYSFLKKNSPSPPPGVILSARQIIMLQLCMFCCLPRVFDTSRYLALDLLILAVFSED
jgi:hypothetical protein